MRKVLSFVACSVLLTAAATASASDLRIPQRYAPGSLDQGLVQVLNPADGALWSAWAYRNGAEYDIAVSVRDARGLWSEPTFVGLDDGRNQVRPAIAADTFGNLYLAFADQSSGAVRISHRSPITGAWSAPVRVNSDRRRGTAPSLRVVGDRLVVAYRAGNRVEILDLPLTVGGAIDERYTRTVTDGPDPVGATGPPDRDAPPPPDEENEKRGSRGSGPVLYDGGDDPTDSPERL